MNDQQLKQRIAYLLEHGGIAEVDPLEEIRQRIRMLTYMIAASICLTLLSFVVHGMQ